MKSGVRLKSCEDKSAGQQFSCEHLLSFEIISEKWLLFEGFIVIFVITHGLRNCCNRDKVALIDDGGLT